MPQCQWLPALPDNYVQHLIRIHCHSHRFCSKIQTNAIV